MHETVREFDENNMLTIELFYDTVMEKQNEAAAAFKGIVAESMKRKRKNV